MLIIAEMVDTTFLLGYANLSHVYVFFAAGTYPPYLSVCYRWVPLPDTPERGPVDVPPTRQSNGEARQLFS